MKSGEGKLTKKMLRDCWEKKPPPISGRTSHLTVAPLTKEEIGALALWAKLDHAQGATEYRRNVTLGILRLIRTISERDKEITGLEKRVAVLGG